MSPHRRRRPLVAVAALAISCLLPACGGSSGKAPPTFPVAHPAEPLEFRAVLDEAPGACPRADDSHISDTINKSCLTLAAPAFTAHELRAVTATGTPQWAVQITLENADAERFGALTKSVSRKQAPQNKVALILGTPASGRLLSAPTVQDPITGGALQISGGLDRVSAQTLVHDLGG